MADFKVGDLVMHKNTRYVGSVAFIRDDDWPTKDKIGVKWNLGFTDAYPAEWLELIGDRNARHDAAQA